MKPIANLFTIYSFGMLCLFSSCDKTIHYDGVVLSRHGIPTPNISLGIEVGHGEHSSGSGSITFTTDKDGKFQSTTKICNNCWGSAISTSYSDSGHYEGSVARNGQTGMQINLK